MRERDGGETRAGRPPRAGVRRRRSNRPAGGNTHKTHTPEGANGVPQLTSHDPSWACVVTFTLRRRRVVVVDSARRARIDDRGEETRVERGEETDRDDGTRARGVATRRYPSAARDISRSSVASI